MKLTGKQKQALNNALLSAFPTRGNLAQMMVFQMEENLETVAGGDTYSDVVLNLIQWAESRGLIEKLIVSARTQNTGNPTLHAFAVEVGIESQPDAPKDSGQDKGGNSGAYSRLERIIHRWPDNHAVDIEYLAEFYRRARRSSRAVCRIESYQSMATGFLIAPDLVVTIYHSVESLVKGDTYVDPATNQRTPLDPANCAFRFGYEATVQGLVQKGQAYRLAPDWLVVSSPIDELDFAVLRLDGEPGRDLVQSDEGTVERGWIKPAIAPVLEGSIFYVLHHPEGSPLKFSSGSIMGLTDDSRCTYEVFTAPGSTGAPCFNTAWEVFAVHERRLRTANIQDVKKGVLISEIIKRADVRAALDL